ncbi:hypothetical protein CR513_14845, partial [Mucuna pruriens]
MDQVCKHEDPECSNNTKVQVVETKKLFPTQVATMFTKEYDSAKRSRGQEKTKVNPATKTSVEADLIEHTRAESNSTSKDQKQARVESILDNQVHNHVPFIFDSSTRKNVESNFNLARANSSPAKIMLAHLVPNPNQVGQLDLKATNDNSLSLSPPTELKPLSSHLKYAYLDNEQQLPVIIANNLHQEQEDKLLHVLRQHKKAIIWKLSDLPGINPSICMHRILMEVEAKPI